MNNFYSANLPYPEVAADGACIHDVKCLMESYGGAGGETTAIMQYAYQSYVSESLGEDFHNMFLGIAKVEMHHHELLGETISKLGGRPVIGGNRKFWSGSYPDYTTDVRNMLITDIKGEEAAIAEYRRAANCVNNLSVVELIERIIEDEKRHIEIFREALERLDAVLNLDKR